MVFFPVRKCYLLLKISLLIILVVTVLGLFEIWRGGKRKAAADQFEDEYERQIAEDEARIIPGLGEGGEAAYLTGEDKVKGEESEKKLAMNVYLSDRIAYNRTLADKRNPACARVKYDAELPSASVILIFHNEPYSVVVRTIWSVINSCKRNNPWFQSQTNFVDRSGRKMKLGYPGQDQNSPLVYLKEIILVDDNSTLPELKGKLSHYVRTRLPPDLIRILRLPDRVGLTQARMAGSRAAVGSVLIVLDAHCEGARDWMRPLLHRIKHKRNAVLTPLIDVINKAAFNYKTDHYNIQVGGFTFTGHFTWIDVPEREKKRRGSDISPTWSPTMAGGLFAIDRAYYWELGAYDEQMAGWGGENLEMSFRIWQCGGTLETVPCSRVGHVFRSFHPYSLPANSDTHGINTARMAEVWMDEYAELYYLHRPDLRHNSAKIGDVTHRKILREKLQCKSFKWFLDNIYQEKYVPVRDSYGYGRFRNPSANLCLDTLQREGGDSPLGVYSCHPDLQATQYFSLSLNHELRDEENCAQMQYQRDGDEESKKPRKLLMSTCRGHASERKWRYNPDTKQIQHTDFPLCIDAGYNSGADVLVKPCSEVRSQKWEIDYSESNDFQMTNEIETSDQAFRLQRLRGQRRRSRSLLSVTEDSRRRHSKSKKHHKRTKKNKPKNKFILKLVRTLMNNTEEHLEVDIHCKHQQLYPNNTFVRDLVTILNERNIKVINNGRVFERNKVTQIDEKMDKYDDGKVLNKIDISPDTPVEEPKKHKHKSSQDNLIPTLAKDKDKDKDKDTAGDVLNEQMASLMVEPDVISREGKHGGGRTGAENTTSPKAHRIIIEDFVVMTPIYPGTSKHQGHRKRKRPTTTTTPPPVTEEDNVPQKIASDTEYQMNAPNQSDDKNDSVEESPMVDIETRAQDKPIADEKLAPIKPETNERRAQKYKHKERAKERTLELERNLEIERNQERTEEIERMKERSQEKKRTNIVMKPSAKEKQKEFAKRNDVEDWQPGGSIYLRHKMDPRRHQRTRSSKSRMDADQSDSEKPMQNPRSSAVLRHGKDKSDSERRSEDERNDYKVNENPRSSAVLRHGKDKSDSERRSEDERTEYKVNELPDSTLEETPLPRSRTPAPVKVVMRSNLTFNLGEEFFKWRAAKSRAVIQTDPPTVPTVRSPAVQAWLFGDDVTSPSTREPDVEDEVVYISRPRESAKEREKKEQKETEESSGSSDSASE